MYRSVHFVLWVIGLAGTLASATAATRRVTTAAEFNALGTLNAGDVVIVHAGIYQNVNRTLTCNGTADNPIVIYAEPLGSAVFSGATFIAIRGAYTTVAGFRFDSSVADGGRLNDWAVLLLDRDSKNCRVTNCMFRGFNQGAYLASGTVTGAEFHWLNIFGFNHVVEYCSFEGKAGRGVNLMLDPHTDTLLGERRHIVRYNYFGERTDIGHNGYEAIRVGRGETTRDAPMASTFENNYFYRAIYNLAAQGGENEVISSKTSRNVYRRNTFRECTGQLSLRFGTDSLVEENFFFGGTGIRAGGVGIIDRNQIVRNNYFQDLDGLGGYGSVVVYRGTNDRQYFAADNAKVFHNTFINCSAPINLGHAFVGFPFVTDPVGVELRNNVVQSAVTGAAVFQIQTPVAAYAFSGNHVFHPTANRYGVTGLSGVTYGPAPNLTLDAALGYYVPQSSSAVLDGASATTPATDFDVRGLARPATRRDIGAFEREVTGNGARPLVREDVGPSFHGGPTNTFVPPSSRLINLSILTSLAPGETMTLGTVLGGVRTNGNKALLVRAVGPSLAPLGVTSALADPKLDLFSGQSLTGSNNDWGGTSALSAAFSQVGAFAYASTTSKDAAVYNPALPAGSYTVQVTGAAGTSGTVLAELYDSTAAATFVPATPRLVNVSVLKQLNANESMTAGFVVSGAVSKTVLLRAIGPTLGAAPFNVGGVMVDPKVDLFSGQAVIRSNNDWGGDAALSAAFANVGAFALSGPASKDAAMLMTLAPGNYTAQVSGPAGDGGMVLVEVYEVP